MIDDLFKTLTGVLRLHQGVQDMNDTVKYDDVLYADGLDYALIGHTMTGEHTLAVYDYWRCVEWFEQTTDMSYQDAIEWVDFNVTGAFVGPQTPIFIETIDDSEEE
tara:strand:+ start:3774 stop:4091 length:318 start_codon:yes stop_codon:yes gene_type:complete